MPAPGLRSQAKACGAKRYFTGEPCPHGHLAARLTCDGGCCECKRLNAIERYRANPQAHIAKVKHWRVSNPDKAAALDIRTRNKPERRAKAVVRANRWIKEHKQRHRAFLRTSRSKRKGARGRHTAADISDILRMQRGRCAYCRAKLAASYNVDHITPLSRGGSNDRQNLQMLCVPCNSHKAAKDPAVFARQVGLLI